MDVVKGVVVGLLLAVQGILVLSAFVTHLVINGKVVLFRFQPMLGSGGRSPQLPVLETVVDYEVDAESTWTWRWSPVMARLLSSSRAPAPA